MELVEDKAVKLSLPKELGTLIKDNIEKSEVFPNFPKSI